VNKGLLVLALAAVAALTLSPTASAAETQCVGVLTGMHDNVVVPPNADCTLAGAQVKGNVKILEEGSLLSVSSAFAEPPVTPAVPTNIGGDVQGGNVESSLLSDGTQVGGDFEVKGSNPGTTSGHDMQTRVGGDTQMEENAGTVFVDRSSVGGDLQIAKNTGRLQIERNTVGGDVQIAENVPTSVLSIERNIVQTGNLQVFKNKGATHKQVIFNIVLNGVIQCYENDPTFNGTFNTGKADPWVPLFGPNQCMGSSM
jgi:hypothetical protein